MERKGVEIYLYQDLDEWWQSLIFSPFLCSSWSNSSDQSLRAADCVEEEKDVVLCVKSDLSFDYEQ